MHLIQVKHTHTPAKLLNTQFLYLPWDNTEYTSWHTWRGQSSQGSLPSRHWWLRSRPCERCNPSSHHHPSPRNLQAWGPKREETAGFFGVSDGYDRREKGWRADRWPVDHLQHSTVAAQGTRMALLFTQIPFRWWQVAIRYPWFLQPEIFTIWNTFKKKHAKSWSRQGHGTYPPYLLLWNVTSPA